MYLVCNKRHDCTRERFLNSKIQYVTDVGSRWQHQQAANTVIPVFAAFREMPKPTLEYHQCLTFVLENMLLPRST